MRAFIAFDISDMTKRALSSIKGELEKTGADVKWLNPDSIHLTLKFLGNITKEEEEKISGLLDETARGYHSFGITLFKLGAFPILDHPRVIWVGIDDNCALVETIAERIDEKCSGIGFKREKRAFTAHLTLGRVRSPKNIAALKAGILAGSLPAAPTTIKELGLYKSELTPRGAIYTKLHASPFLNYNG